MSDAMQEAAVTLLKRAKSQNRPRSLYWSQGEWVSVPTGGVADMRLLREGAKLVGVYTHRAQVDEMLEDMREVIGVRQFDKERLLKAMFNKPFSSLEIRRKVDDLLRDVESGAKGNLKVDIGEMVAMLTALANLHGMDVVDCCEEWIDA